MYWFVSRNHPYLGELNKNLGNTIYKRQFEDMEIDLKKKLNQVREFNPDKCFNLDNDSDVSFFSEMDEKDQTDGMYKMSQLTKVHSQTFLSNQSALIAGAKTKILKRITTLKTYIRVFDFLSALIIMLGAIIAQYENELYYMDNIHTRVTGVVLIQSIFTSPGNNSWETIFDDNKINMTMLLEWEGPSMESLTYNFLRRSREDNSTLINSVTQTNNEDVLMSHVDPSIFNYEPNLEDTDRIKIPLQISEFNNSLRKIILILTIVSIVLLFLSRYCEHLRENVYKVDKEILFFRSESFFYFLCEGILTGVVQYPSINGSLTLITLGSTMCLPYTSILAAISIFRFVFIYKIFKCLTFWNSQIAEVTCEKYVCLANSGFAFKALQKEKPFLTLMVIFVLTCVCFGFSLRIFEMHYWESQVSLNQNWRYHWNALWCVFVSMTTVGYGDFFPKTHYGRFIVILACIVGVYFVSMMMVFMTQKSIMSESEQKAYKLIARLKLRSEVKDIHSHIVLHGLNIFLLSKKKKKNEIDQNNYEIKYNKEKREIYSYIEDKKSCYKRIKTLDIMPTKEQLFDISERIEVDIKEIRREIESLKIINNSIISHTDSQMDMIKYLQKNFFASKLFLELIDKKPIGFGKLKKFDRKILAIDAFHDSSENDNMDPIKEATIEEEENNIDAIYYQNQENGGHKRGSLVNKPEGIPQLNLGVIENKNNSLLSESESDDDYYAEELNEYNVTSDECRDHFDILFNNLGEASKKTTTKNVTKSLAKMNNIKDYQKKLDMILMIKKTVKSPRKKTVNK